MTYCEILSAAQSLSETERQSLIQTLSPVQECEARFPESSCLSSLLEKQSRCPQCGSSRYCRFGKDKGTQRFKCKAFVAGLSLNIRAHSNRSSIRRVL